MKMKTRKSVAKRVSFTATGKIKVRKAGQRHNLGNKSRSLKLKKRQISYVFPGERKHIEKCLPYGV